MPKILVIEDEQSVREDILEILENHGFESLGAEDGLIGMQLARNYQPDLIICDIIMPNLDGYGVLQELRSSDGLASTPFMFMTAKADRASHRLGMNLGADDYITKPIGQNDLLEAIATRLQKNLYQTTTQDLIRSLQTAEEKLNYLSQRDSLTGLLNRYAFKENFNRAIATRVPLAILIIDLDRFKRINRTKGYLFADALLQLVAQRLGKALVNNDYSLARLNADEFAILIKDQNPQPSLKSPLESSLESKVESLSQSILDSLSQSFVIDRQEIRINASIGSAFFPEHGQNLDTLMQSATTALQQAKISGGNTFGVYNANIQEPEDSLELEIDLYKAIERNQLELYYQPQVCLKTGKIKGVEALLRWEHPKYGSVPWHKFIPLAERNGAIMVIGEWVILSACQQMKAWHHLLNRQGSELIKVSVNLSPRQFQQASLGQMLDDILTKTDLNPNYLDLELTESTIVQDIEGSIARLNYFKSLGVEISLDDFGTGYSSLSYLQQFPLNTLKIDQGFVRNMAINSKNKAIVIAMIQLGHSMHLRVLAEGVETKDELDILVENNCDLIQGHLFSKALPALELESLLIQDRRLII
ncbi:diguanylate cyclase (GGDEF) domain-containing protein [Synechococcus sp. PCC 7502]|uniref:putative bifunctional diguanylate cyclase/phosphodiesterase n=1 Tax=Synechococcus sp. PCC 7502 TaxID=1173263 RepID=UPI00029FDE1D|nr:GGDEF domain-containing response regulator [Synechococcus sp. PCC 7502]AFY74538.1 diguanylate cyclase (GGDEF) domain-containing protein [Synechococcus sp. PCC 7502]